MMNMYVTCCNFVNESRKKTQRNHYPSVPEEATIIGFADDLAVIDIVKQPEDGKVYANEIICPTKEST